MLASRFSHVLLALPAATLAFAASAQPAAAPPLPALAGLEQGMWTLKPAAGGRGDARQLCLGDRAQLLQVQHQGTSCARYVIANDPANLTVSYSCPGGSSGQTQIKVETRRLIQLHTQGIDRGAPFDYALEGRLTGICPVASR